MPLHESNAGRPCLGLLWLPALLGGATSAHLVSVASALLRPDAGAADAASSSLAAGDGVEVTGPSAPLALVLSHSVDAARRSITLRCAVHNRTLEAIKGVEVRLAGLQEESRAGRLLLPAPQLCRQTLGAAAMGRRCWP